MKKIGSIVFLGLLLAATLLLAGCGGGGKSASKGTEKVYKVGVCAGPYGPMFDKAIRPTLEAKGYKIKLVEFSDYVQPNTSLAEGEIDASLFQNQVFLENSNKALGFDLKWVAEVPTAPINIYSAKYKKMEELPDGAVIAIPNDNTNILRSLRVLEQGNYITLKADIDAAKVTPEGDILENPHHYKIKAANAELLPGMLDSVDAAIINGNYAVGAGLNLADAIFFEKIPDRYYNTITVRKEDVDAQFTKDIISAIYSDAFRKVIEDKSNPFFAFARPAGYNDNK